MTQRTRSNQICLLLQISQCETSWSRSQGNQLTINRRNYVSFVNPDILFQRFIGLAIQVGSYCSRSKKQIEQTCQLQVVLCRKYIGLPDSPSYPNFSSWIQLVIEILFAFSLCIWSLYFLAVSQLRNSINLLGSEVFSIISEILNLPLTHIDRRQTMINATNADYFAIQFQINGNYKNNQQRYIYIIQKMKPNQENNQKNEDYQALINQEYNLVVDGKAADKLVKLLRDYEVDPFAVRIQKVEGLIEKYTHALLINGQYLDLSFLFRRYSQALAPTQKTNELLRKVAEAGKRENLKQLWEQTKLYIEQLPKKTNIGSRIKEATIDSTIDILSKYYLNFGVEELTKLTGITEKELLERGIEIRNKFIVLKQKVVQSDCLQSKLKEIAVIASRMSQFE